MGLKTTYYLRTLGASQVEKSTLDADKFGYTQRRDRKSPQACSINKNEEEDCGGCQ
jgi:ribonucleoside-diphosphate reductase alpha chain